MARPIEETAVLVMAAGFLLFHSMETVPVGALLVAVGAYGLVLPQFVDPWEPDHVPRRP